MSELRTTANIIGEISDRLKAEVQPYTWKEKLICSLFSIIPIGVYIILVSTTYTKYDVYSFTLSTNILMFCYMQLEYYIFTINIRTLRNGLGSCEIGILIIMIISRCFAYRDRNLNAMYDMILINLSQVVFMLANKNLTHLFNNQPNTRRYIRFIIKFICSLILSGYSYLMMHYVIEYCKTDDIRFMNIARIIIGLSPIIISVSVMMIYTSIATFYYLTKKPEPTTIDV